MTRKLLLPALLLLIASSNIFGQKWAQDMQDPNANLYQVQQEFEAYWSTRDITEKGKGYKAFKRWEHFVAPRVYPTGNLSLLNETAINWQNFLKSQATSGGGKNIGGSPSQLASATWTAMGPHGALSGQAGNQLLKSGRLNFITVDQTNTLSIWVGAPAGGLWHTTNGGTSWTTNTDNLPVIGCSDLVIDPTNSSVMYLATGDGDAGDTRSIGVLKSTDGGVTWLPTGLTNNVTNYFLIRKLLINPNNPQIILAATSSGIYRTINGGTNWTVVSSSGAYDLEFKPGNPNVVYSGGTSFRMSTNGGASFTQITSGLSSGGFQRVAVAVTPADTNYVYLLGSNSANGGFLGLYRSVVGGTTFAVMSTSATINVLGWNTNGQDVGGQGWYDLALAASPLNKNEIVTGGVNIWRSLDGGSTWAIYSHWTGSGAPFAHADQHELEYITNGTLFSCNDGTVYRRGTTNWTEISGTMNISQIYKIGMASTIANKWITGHQDNGTSVFTGTTYNAELGGDGMDCFIDRTNDQILFGESQNGGFQRSLNNGTNWSSCTNGMSGTAPWITVWKQDPVSAGTFYAGRVNLFRSTNLSVTGTATWGTLAALPSAGSINEFAIAPSNNQIIYVLKNTGIFKTTNAGTSWSTITGTVPVAGNSPQFISIDPLDANNAWVVLSGYTAGSKVYMTSDGGVTWVNYSANLPNLPGNCCVYQPGTNDMIYVGMDVGIYYRNATSSQWTLYNQGLPNVPISDMEISPATPNLLHAATYGRGVWVASVITSTGAPVSQFAIPAIGMCTGNQLVLNDQSANTPTSWSWTVTPSTGFTISSTSAQNPTVTFNATGTYTVSMIATNSLGVGNTYTQTIQINNGPNLSVAINSQSVCVGKTATFTASGASTYSWSNAGGTSSTAVYSPVASAVYTVTGTSNNCSAKQTVSVSVLPSPVLVIAGTSLSCPGEAVMLTASGAVNYTWSSGSNTNTTVVSPTTNTSYNLTGEDANGCVSTSVYFLGVYPITPVIATADDSLICANEIVTLTGAGAQTYTWNPGNQSGNVITFQPAGTTNFTLTGSDNNGCLNSAQITVSVSACDGIVKLGHGSPSMISVFPNPATDKINLRNDRSVNFSSKIQILDVNGRVVLEKKISLHASEIAELNITSLSAGTYLIKIHGENDNTQLSTFVKSASH